MAQAIMDGLSPSESGGIGDGVAKLRFPPSIFSQIDIRDHNEDCLGRSVREPLDGCMTMRDVGMLEIHMLKIYELLAIDARPFQTFFKLSATVA
jgi:hypothetical protein